MEGEEERVMNVGGDWLVFVVTKERSAGGRQDGAADHDKMGRQHGQIAGINCHGVDGGVFFTLNNSIE